MIDPAGRIMTRHDAPMLNRRENRGRALRLIRESKGLLAKDVAAKAGFSASYLSELETGIRNLSEGAVAKIAPAFEMDAPELEALLESRLVELRDVSPARPDNLIRSGERSSSKLHEEPSPRRVMLINAPPDTDALLRHLVADMSRDEMFLLLNKLITAAHGGDASAFGKAKALFELIPAEAPAVPPPQAPQPTG